MNQTIIDLLEANASHARAFDSRFDGLQKEQRPVAVTVSCSDSRVLQDHMWDNDTPGRLFTCSNIGNRVVHHPDTDGIVSGDVLYPLIHTGTKLAIVVGHTGCGAITAAYESLAGGHADPAGIERALETLTADLEHGLDALPDALSHESAVNYLVEYNVDRQIQHLLASPAVPNDVQVLGVVYDFQDVYGGRRGAVHVTNIDGETNTGRLRDRYPEVQRRIDRLWEGGPVD